jgi:hypothetical protein
MSNKENKTIETWLPLFKGFYGTIWDGDSELDEFCDSNDVDSDNVSVNWLGYRQEIATVLTDKIAKELIKLNLIESMKFQHVSSPQYYNFTNDSIDVEIVAKAENIAAYIYTDINEFDAYLKERYTPRDGFMPHYSNSAAEWSENTEGFTELSGNSHVLGCILDFILRAQELTERDFYDDVIGEVNFDNFATITYTDINDLDNDDKAELIRQNLSDIDLESGYLKILSNEAMAKSILLGTDFIEELVEIGWSELASALSFNQVNEELEPR